MSEDFKVNNPGLEADHDHLDQLINQGVRVVQDLNPVLNRMFTAVESTAVPIWHELRVRWNAHYDEMMRELGGIGSSSRNAHHEFVTGDHNAARCFAH